MNDKVILKHNDALEDKVPKWFLTQNNSTIINDLPLFFLLVCLMQFYLNIMSFIFPVINDLSVVQ